MDKLLFHSKQIVSTCVMMILYSELGLVNCGGAKDMRRLHKYLLANYSSDVRPSLDYNTATEITACLHLSSVMDMDFKNQKMKLIGYFSFTWRDDLLKWNTTDYGNITEILLPGKKVWKPDMAIYNSVIENVYLGNAETIVTINYGGLVRWEPVISMAVSCKVDVSMYPFDNNICTVDVLSWMNDNTSVKLIPAEEPFVLDNFVPNGEFWITTFGTEDRFEVNQGKFYVELRFRLNLLRRPGHVVLTLLVPLTLLACLCVVSFLMSPGEPEKVPVAITFLLAFTMFLGIVDNDIPEASEPMCLIVIYIVLLLVQSFLSVASNALIVLIHHRDKKDRKQESAALQDGLLPHQERKTQKGNSQENLPFLFEKVYRNAESTLSNRKSALKIWKKSFVRLRNLIFKTSRSQGEPEVDSLGDVSLNVDQGCCQRGATYVFRRSVRKKVSEETDIYLQEANEWMQRSRSFRLNRFCLILNIVVLVAIISVFTVLFTL